MATWPASLPQKQFLGMREQIDPDPILRTQMDAGPSTTRKRYTAVTRVVRAPLIIKGDQRQTFDTFYENDINFGADSFDWEDPVTDTTVSFKFRSPPTWRLRRGGTPNNRVWETELELEIQP